VTEKTVYRWIKEKNLPAYKIQDQYRFNRPALLEWAQSQRLPLPPQLLEKEDGEEEVTLPKALENGGIHYGISGQTKGEVLARIAQFPKLPSTWSAQELTQLLLAREALTSTGIGRGFAVPHVRNPIVLPVKEPSIDLCFLKKPIDFGAIDDQPVHTLFLLLSSTIRGHLRLLAKISYALHDAIFPQMLEARAPQEQIFEKIAALEKELEPLQGLSKEMGGGE
jgi:PTS system nitrogen regulatory IIA component